MAKPYSQATKDKYDIPCFDLIQKYSNVLQVKKFLENDKDILIDAFVYHKNGALCCLYELEWNSGLEFPSNFEGIHHLKHKTDKYTKYEFGIADNFEFYVPSFYIHFTEDFKHVFIVPFAKIDANEENLRYPRCYDEYGNMYNQEVYLNSFDNGTWSTIQDYEKVILEYLKDRSIFLPVD